MESNFMDNPVNNLDPVGIREMRELFLKLVHKEGITILLSSHILSEIEQIADRIGVIFDGALIEEARMEEIRRRYPNGMEEYFMSMVNGGEHE